MMNYFKIDFDEFKDTRLTVPNLMPKEEYK